MSRTFSRSEVKAHGTEDKGLYIIIDSDVYEMSGFINEHPGGQTILRKFGGKDATKAFWRLLGIDKSASERDIKKAYRTLSKKYHPDKNPGDESAHQRFVEIAEAYDALSDEETRKIYDQYGHDGVTQHKQGGGPGGQHHDPFDLFSRFFGGGGHFGHGSPGQRRGPDMELRAAIPLRDFYTGATHDLGYEKQMICEKCEGSGSADGKVDTCQQCGGHGRVLQKHMLAPGIFQQVQTSCDACGGKGKTIRHKCSVCGGERIVRRPNTVTVDIEPGMPKGQRLTFENEADDHPDHVAGDLHVVILEDEPRLGDSDDTRTDGTFFRRKGDDLFWREVLSLREAWLGDWTRNLTHLDGHTVQLSRKRGEVVQPNAVEVIKDEGMPLWREDRSHHDQDHAETHGRLVVEYVVVLPDKMDKGIVKEFEAVWAKLRKKSGVDLGKDSGRPNGGARGKGRDEL
ncbi:MAG: hypothetical protein M1819_000946 [Sarea resinae]|nr:MAG: hypothetical protein M1819_000946 [Sarea resinae]